MNLESHLSAVLAEAFAAVAGRPVDPAVRASQHADFQSNAALALAGELGRPPREIAAEVAGKARLDGTATVAVSGPGFLNLHVDDAFLVSALSGKVGAETPKRIVIDYSGPNVAKEMHVGHLRSTIIGDALARILTRQGHDVVRVNHLGDWGTQFGMLIEHLSDLGAGSDHSLGDLTAFYRDARITFDNDDDFRTRARLRVVALQGGDPATRDLWRLLVSRSEVAFHDVYARLGVTLAPGDFVGESFYQDRLDGVVDDLIAKGLLVESEGALCAFPEGFTGRDGEPLPLIVRKSDGGYGYAATDLAALRYRIGELGADELLYVVGAPQHTHFRMVFAVARSAGWIPPDVTPEHVEFGSILGADGKMFKTRSGTTVKLADLLDEAAVRASTPEVGIGAIKYADLANDRRSDYVFDWDRMLASTGNTGPYLQYAYARIRSIFRNAATQTPGGDSGPDASPIPGGDASATGGDTPVAGGDASAAGGDASAAGSISLGDPAERRLALALAAFEPAVEAAAANREPHRLAGYLHGLAVAFTAFYEKCPILKADPDVRASRLALSGLTGRTLHEGLTLLGIPVPDEM